MAFNDERLSDEVERGARGGPGIKVNIATSDSGVERRNRRDFDFRRRYNIAYGVQSKTRYTELLEHYLAVGGGETDSFPFKDWSDYEMARQQIGTTDGSTATFQIFKTYTRGSFTYDRNLTKPIVSTTRCWVDNVEISQGAGASEFQVDRLTGIITLGSTLAAQNLTAVEAQCEFDVPVRYDIDLFSLELLLESAGSVPNLPLIEVLRE